MTQSKDTRRGVVVYSSNPFIPPLPTKSKRICNQRGDMMLVNSSSGEVTAPVAGFWAAEIVDNGRFVKLFVKGVRALKDLSSAGGKVFEVLYLRLQEEVGKGVVIMSFASIDQAITPMCRAVYNRGMKELIDKSFIAASTTQGVFFVNPDFVFNGDRLAFVQEYRKKGTNKTNSQNLFSDTNENQISLDI
jgi:hypothetical protein